LYFFAIFLSFFPIIFPFRVFELIKCLLCMHSSSWRCTNHSCTRTDRQRHCLNTTRTLAHSHMHAHTRIHWCRRVWGLILSRSSTQLALSSRKSAHDASIWRFLGAFFAQVACVIERVRKWVSVRASLPHRHQLTFVSSLFSCFDYFIIFPFLWFKIKAYCASLMWA